MSKVSNLRLGSGCGLRHFQKFGPPIWPLFLPHFNCPYGSVEFCRLQGSVESSNQISILRFPQYFSFWFSKPRFRYILIFLKWAGFCVSSPKLSLIDPQTVTKNCWVEYIITIGLHCYHGKLLFLKNLKNRCCECPIIWKRRKGHKL